MATARATGGVTPQKETVPPIASHSRGAKPQLRLTDFLKPHVAALVLGFLAVVGEGLANLLQPWPLKIVLDDVLRARESHATAIHWLYRFVGTDKIALLKFACLAVLGIALLDAISSYFEKYLTTSVAQ